MKTIQEMRREIEQLRADNLELRRRCAEIQRAAEMRRVDEAEVAAVHDRDADEVVQ